MRRAFVIIGISLSIVLVIAVSLVHFASFPNKKSNGFLRKWNNTSIAEVASMRGDFSKFYIAGLTEGSIYLSTPTNPYFLLKLSSNLELVDTLSFMLPKIKGNIVPSIISIDSPNIYIHSRNLRSVFSGTFSNKYFHHTRIPGGIFTRSAQMSKERVIVRGVDSKSSTQTFKIVSLPDSSVVKEAQVIKVGLEESFARDGFLEFNKRENHIIYIEKYTNNFYKLDSQLSIQYKGHTIDTISFGNSNLGSIEGGGKMKIAPRTSRILVNNEIAIANSIVFVNSSLRADNESFDQWLTYNVFDLYSEESGKYLGSFKIDNHKQDKLVSFKVNNSSIVLLYANRVIKYHFSL